VQPWLRERSFPSTLTVWGHFACALVASGKASESKLLSKTLAPFVNIFVFIFSKKKKKKNPKSQNDAQKLKNKQNGNQALSKMIFTAYFEFRHTIA
jgi:hypothetical protein